MSELVLDHIGVAIKQLERGREAYARLGFRLTARSQHAGSPTPGAPVVPWGSGNHCAMLREGYLEIVGLTHPERYSSIKDMVERYEGPHIVALGCANADRAYEALAAAGVTAERPRALERDAAVGVNDESLARARFRNIYLDRAAYPEGRFLVIEHLTRDLLWQPHLLEHPNGALALAEVYFCAEDAQATAAKLGRVFGATPLAHGDAHVTLPLARGLAHVLSAEQWQARSGGGPIAPLPMPVGFGVRVASLERTRKLLADNGVRHAESNGLWVGPGDACGATIRFFKEN